MQINLDHPVNPKRRWTEDTPHPQIDALLRKQSYGYHDAIEHILDCADDLAAIPTSVWQNDFFSGLDAAALYSFVAKLHPRTYLEIGSGNSTKFARRAISKRSPRTRLVSIDPEPRTEIDNLCDETIRMPLEDVSLSTFSSLQSGDILLMDGSHRTFQNSDATVFVLDVLPSLAKGVLVGVHDITLPFDYPEAWLDRHYSEQYLLGAYLLGGGIHDIVLPAAYVSADPLFSSILAPLWARLPGVETHGCALWFRS